MRRRIWVLVVLFVLLLVLAVGCDKSDETVTTSPTQVSHLDDDLEPTRTLESERTDSAPVCPPAEGEGTISPAVSIYSITFVVNGAEQVLFDGDTLEAMVGDEIEIRETVICAGSFIGSGGEACVDLAPVDQSGQEIMSEHAGTHMVPVVAGLTTIPGPNHTWTLAENWVRISAVLNHWTPEDTEDVDCANRRCEHDDWAIIMLR
ncbi:MAG: hypothetical protein PVF70_06550 [Anaerolineales bacterium]